MGTYQVQTFSNAFIATFDILGVTQMMLSAQDKDLEDLSQRICETFNEVENRMRNLIKQCFIDPIQQNSALETLQKMDFTTFSDTIVMECDLDKASSTEEKRRLLMQFLQRSCFIADEMLHRGYPVRGCIDFGKVCFSKTTGLFFGKPYVNSLKIAEMLDFSGIVLTDVAKEEYGRHISKPEQVVQHLNIPVPIKNETFKDMNCINWLARTDFEKFSSLDLRQILYQKFSDNNKRMNESAIRKMVNTENTIRAFLIQGEFKPSSSLVGTTRK